MLRSVVRRRASVAMTTAPQQQQATTYVFTHTAPLPRRRRCCTLDTNEHPQYTSTKVITFFHYYSTKCYDIFGEIDMAIY